MWRTGTIQPAEEARHVPRRGDRHHLRGGCRVRGGPPPSDPKDGLVTYRIGRSTTTAALYYTALKSILIADGNESVAELFAHVFASHDWNVTRYSDGMRAGEELCGRTHYDAVLVSYRFDGMDGLELIKLIRALDHRKDVPIVMVTGTQGLDVVTTALTAGADDVLYKPIDLAVLVATVSQCVERGKRQGT